MDAKREPLIELKGVSKTFGEEKCNEGPGFGLRITNLLDWGFWNVETECVAHGAKSLDI